MPDLGYEPVDGRARVIEHRKLVRAWITENADTLRPFRTEHATTEEELTWATAAPTWPLPSP